MIKTTFTTFMTSGITILIICFTFTIIGLASFYATTFNKPLATTLWLLISSTIVGLQNSRRSQERKYLYENFCYCSSSFPLEWSYNTEFGEVILIVQNKLEFLIWLCLKIILLYLWFYKQMYHQFESPWHKETLLYPN